MAPATTSMTAWKPDGAAAAASGSTAPRFRSTVSWAPARRTASCLSVLHTATTRAPRATASWTAARPTLPEEPVTSTVWPSRTSPRSSIPSAVPKAIGSAASSASLSGESSTR